MENDEHRHKDFVQGIVIVNDSISKYLDSLARATMFGSTLTR